LRSEFVGAVGAIHAILGMYVIVSAWFSEPTGPAEITMRWSLILVALNQFGMGVLLVWHARHRQQQQQSFSHPGGRTHPGRSLGTGPPGTGT
jgi:hypothetical protein